MISMTSTETVFAHEIKIASTMPFVAVVRRHETCRIGTATETKGIKVHARAEKVATIEARLRREGFFPGATGVWVLRRAGQVVAEAEVVAR